MAAAEEQNQKSFDGYYLELKQLFEENENTDKDHLVLWETLTDFTDELSLAMTIYEQALIKAEVINSTDFLSSIEHLEKAKISCAYK